MKKKYLFPVSATKIMKILRLYTVASSLSLSLIGGASATTIIDFNDGANGSDIASFYSALGVTFTTGEWNGANVAGVVYDPLSTGLRLSGDSGGGNQFRPKDSNPIAFTFAFEVSSVSLIANNVNENGARIDLYDSVAGGNLVGTNAVFGAQGNLESNFILSASGVGVRRVEIYQPRSLSQEGVVFDNLTFDASPVPEPSSAMLLGIGCLGAFHRGSRKWTRPTSRR